MPDVFVSEGDTDALAASEADAGKAASIEGDAPAGTAGLEA